MEKKKGKQPPVGNVSRCLNRRAAALTTNRSLWVSSGLETYTNAEWLVDRGRMENICSNLYLCRKAFACILKGVWGVNNYMYL